MRINKFNLLFNWAVLSVILGMAIWISITILIPQIKNDFDTLFFWGTGVIPFGIGFIYGYYKVFKDSIIPKPIIESGLLVKGDTR